MVSLLREEMYAAASDWISPIPIATAAALPGDLRPPMIAAVKPLTLYSSPVSHDTVVIGAMTTPARPPMAPPTVKTRRLTNPVLIPIRRAAIGLVETALMARPAQVALRDQKVAAIATTVVPQTHSAWVGTYAPTISITPSP